jgi:hypothetical protein
MFITADWENTKIAQMANLLILIKKYLDEKEWNEKRRALGLEKGLKSNLSFFIRIG